MWKQKIIWAPTYSLGSLENSLCCRFGRILHIFFVLFSFLSLTARCILSVFKQKICYLRGNVVVQQHDVLCGGITIIGESNFNYAERMRIRVDRRNLSWLWDDKLLALSEYASYAYMTLTRWYEQLKFSGPFVFILSTIENFNNFFSRVQFAELKGCAYFLRLETKNVWKNFETRHMVCRRSCWRKSQRWNQQNINELHSHRSKRRSHELLSRILLKLWVCNFIMTLMTRVSGSFEQ